MIITNIRIENFKCYAGDNTLNPGPRLNLLVGENGEGKTVFYDAILWLINGTQNQDLKEIVSAFAIKNNTDGKGSISVTIRGEDADKNKIKLSRSFQWSEINSILRKESPEKLRAYLTKPNGERETLKEQTAIQLFFPPELMKYSLFKGEGELRILENEDSLKNLVNLFSDARFFERVYDSTKTIQGALKTVVDRSVAKNNKAKIDLDRLQKAEAANDRKKASILNDMKDNGRQRENAEAIINDAENAIDKAEELKSTTDSIKAKKEEIERIKKIINAKPSLTNSLFDDLWILKDFEPIFMEFKSKVEEADVARRKIQSEFDIEQGRKQGIVEGISRLLDSQDTPLDINIPSQQVMEELIRDEHCKVCDTPAPKGSSQYEFMRRRLEKFLESQKPKNTIDIEVNQEQALKHTFIRELVSFNTVFSQKVLDMRELGIEIKESEEFLESRRNELSQLEAELDELEQERNNIVSQSDDSEETLSRKLKDHRGASRDLSDWKDHYRDLKEDLRKVEEEIAANQAKIDKLRDSSSGASTEKNNLNLINDALKIIEETKKTELSAFVQKLTKVSNDYYKRMNLDNFTGRISIELEGGQGLNPRINIFVITDERKMKAKHLNKSTETSVHLSVLFAVSKLAESSDLFERTPIFMDAPVSSFGETKSGQFLEVLSGLENQIFITSKDYTQIDDSGEISLSKPIHQIPGQNKFWLRLKRPFNDEQLSTLNTEIQTL